MNKIFPFSSIFLVLLLSACNKNELLFSIDSNNKELQASKGQTYAVAWGDVDRDGWIDLWVNNHIQPSAFFKNENGTFRDYTDEYALSTGLKDTHGAQWADIDNDGDLDLLQLVGGGRGAAPDTDFYGNILFINENGIFKNEALERGVRNSPARSRNPIFYDIDKDGDLDFLMSAAERDDGKAKAVFYYNDGGFFDKMKELEFNNNFIYPDYAILGDFSNDRACDLLAIGGNAQPLLYHDSNDHFLNFNSLSGKLKTKNLAGNKEILIGDFNNDLVNDLFVFPYTKIANTFECINDSLVELKIAIEKDSPFKFSFECDSNFIVEYLPLLFEKKDVPFFVGSIKQSKLGGSLNVDLSEVNRYLGGNTDAVEDGFQIYYDAILKRWNVFFHSHEPLFTFILLKGKFRNIRMHSEKKIWNNKPYYLLSGINGYSKAFLKMDDKIRFISKAVCGDFDNDGDLDVFGVKNENDSRNNHVLLQNDGQSSFTIIVNPAGDNLFSNEGIIGVLSKADYDNDGDLDIMVASGNLSPLREDQQRYCLLNNLTDNSNYLTLTLHGTKSNRDGIGATIIAYAEGKAQMREQDGGVARRAQSDSRIHFGFGDSKMIDSLFVYWPCGLKQKFENITSNQFLTIIEQE